MAKVNWKDTGDEIPQPGIYLAEVKKCEEKRSKNSGDMMFEVQLADPATGQSLCIDYIMLEGKGWKMGREKLFALGISDTQDEVTPQDILNRLVYVALIHEKNTFKRRDGTDGEGVNVKVNREATQPWCGYWHETQKPEGYAPQNEAPF